VSSHYKPRARATDPQTSHDAADAVNTAPLESAILRALAEAGECGLNLDELIEATGYQKVAVSPAMRPLWRLGMVVENGTRVGRAGRQQIVWVLAKKDER
jgi:DNA-binding MarR family transcriptional regulator